MNALIFQVVVVFYVAIVLLLIGTNLRASRAGRSARFKKHVVEFSENSGKAETRLVPERERGEAAGGGGGGLFEYEDDVVEV